MRILFVLEHFHPYIGGAERLFQELTTALVREGQEVTVVTTRFRQDLPVREDFGGVHIHRITCRNRFLFSFLSLGAVWRHARKCDLVHTTSYNAALPAWLGARLAGKPVVITFHEVWGRLWNRLPFIPFPLRLAYRMWEVLILQLRFDRVIAVSRATQRALEMAGVPPSRIDLIYNGLDYDRFPNNRHRPSRGFSFTYFGRLGASKGLDLLLPAAARFLRDYPEARFNLVIPRYPESLYLQVMRLMSDQGLAGQVDIKHDLSREKLFEVILGSSCVVIPSYSEGFCFVAAEAVALGVPVISSQKAALEEVVGGSFLPIEPFTIEGLVEALAKAHKGEWAFRKPVHFPLQESVERYLALYREWLSVRTGASG